MVNGDAVEHAVQLVRAAGLDAAIGLHLNLTEGVAVCDPECVGSLLDQEQQLLGKTKFRDACAAGTVASEEVAREVEAQLGRFAELMGGRPPAHVDGHQHCHVLALTAPIIADALQRRSVRFARIPEEPGALVSLCSVCSVVSREAAAARCVYLDHGVKASEGFVGLSFCGATYSANDLVSAVRKQLDSGRSSIEAMVHPGLLDPNGYDSFNTSQDRVEELRVLCGTELTNQLEPIVRLCRHDELNKHDPHPHDHGVLA
eukprot:TRINITY_DN19461_c0_g1_i2.p1 TRINITY_DN19461_c0_g1~~TRINITY_DN19461_c0_g1_i2.p1  ORF type:complete len:259 (-),score=43.51 TRINITY_DN19461_c0_g1_i2:167-943(-)